MGPTQRVIAPVRGEAILSCRLTPKMNARTMDVKWFQVDRGLPIHWYRGSRDGAESEGPEYDRRTEFQKENIAEGTVTLKLHGVRASDEGLYKCLFQSPFYSNEAQFRVQVAGTGSVPHIHIEEDERRGIRLICSSSGWYPRPRVRWKDPRGHRLPPASEKTHQEGDGLYAAETSFVLAAESKENVSCFIQNPLLDLDKEMRISVADSLFPRVSLEKTVLIVIVTVLFFLLSSSAYVHWIRHRAKEALQEECEKLREDLKRRKLLGEEVDVTLDPSSADLYLIVSEDKKAVRSVGKKLDLADLEDRFDNPFAVLGHQRFDRGCHYWEVGVEGKTRWTLGLCKQSIPRKGRYISASPESGFWALSPKNTDNYQALTSSRAPIYVIEPPRAVGIFLEYEEGRVSFCNVTEGTWLYTFKASFTETLRPYFYPGPLSKGKNVNPLIILPRPREGRGARSDGPSTQESKPLMDGDGQHGEESETR